MATQTKLFSWLQRRIQAYIDEKVIIQETWEVEKVATKSVKLPYVLLENKSLIINKFILPIRIQSVNLEIWNNKVMVGRVLLPESAKIKAFSQKTVCMEVRLSHITAVFNMLRYLLTNVIVMEVKGTIEIRLLWMSFYLQVDDMMAIPRKKFQLIIDSAKV